MKIKVIVINRKNAKYDITKAICSDIKYKTERVGVASTITFDVLKSDTPMSFHEGDPVYIYIDDKLYILCYIFAKSKKQKIISVTCYDLLRYLKYKESYNFIQKTASQRIRQMANEFNLPVGEIEEISHILPDKIYEDKTLLDIMTDSLMETAVATGKIYTLFDDRGKITLKESKNMINKNVIGNKSFATDYTYKTSIENSYNYIKLVKPNKETGKGDVYIAKDQGKVNIWGRLQYYEKVDENLNDSQIRERAKTFLKYYAKTERNLKIDAIGELSIRAGSVVLIDIPALGDIDLRKMLLIEKCTHNIDNYHHTMSLEMKVINDG